MVLRRDDVVSLYAFNREFNAFGAEAVACCGLVVATAFGDISSYLDFRKEWEGVRRKVLSYVSLERQSSR